MKNELSMNSNPFNSYDNGQNGSFSTLTPNERRELLMKQKEHYFKEKKIDEKRREIEERIQRELRLNRDISQEYHSQNRSISRSEGDSIHSMHLSNLSSDLRGVDEFRNENVRKQDETSWNERKEIVTPHQNDDHNQNLNSEFNTAEEVDTSRLLGEIAFSLESRLRDSILREMNRESKVAKQKQREGYKEMDVFLAEEIASKICAICYELMKPPDHTPNILFPCGHTYCMQCCKSLLKQNTNKCPECRSIIQSHAVNIPLKQLIESFVQKEKELKKKHKENNPGSQQNEIDIASLWKHHQNQKTDIEDDKILKMIYSQVPKDNQMVVEKYYNDYKKLSLRSKLLHHELKDIHTEVSQLGKQEDHLKKKILDAQIEEDAIQKDIKMLMDGLEEIQKNLEKVKLDESNIMKQKKQSMKKIEMISGTLQSLESQKEKSFVLLQKFIPNIKNLLIDNHS